MSVAVLGGGLDVVNFGCRLNIAEGEAVRAAANSPQFKGAMDKVSTPVSYLDASEFRKYWDRDAARLKAILEKLGRIEDKK